MRTYIFTDRERKIVQKVLGERITVREKNFVKIKSRIKLFDRLRDDIFLYLELYDKLLLDSVET